MVTDAEELLADLHEQQGYEGGLFKMENDPRITPPGRGCAASPSTSCPSWSTCCAAT